ncbi:MAG TPA: hypothetical protein VE571_10445 [Solirubrobacteraceae bacterium]|nr:hypothetical protein [Solirubrobacteraceae bacterium]
MPTVETVRGPVDVDALGTTLMHEHIFILGPEMLQNYGHVWGDSFWEEEERVADAIAKLTRAREGGIETIVDPTAPGLGRYIPRIQRVNEAVDINLIVATGIYAFLELPNFLATRSDDAITGIFVREIREGIDDTGVKAAFLKCAVELHGIVGDVPRILGCIAAAQVETGVPVMVHTNARAQTGRLALEFLTARGVDPTKIVIAHAGDSNDLDYLRAIADQGAWLGQDRYGIEHFNPSADRLATTTALIAQGYADRIHLGHDSACFYDFMAHNPRFADEKPDLLRIHAELLPALRENGVRQEQIDQMLVGNPRAFFGSAVADAGEARQAEALRPGRT